MIGTELQATGRSSGLYTNHWIAQERRRLASQLRTHATLLPEQWRELDTQLLLIAEQYMGGVMDLRSRNLVHPVGGMGWKASQYNIVGGMEDATVAMDPSAAGNFQRLSIDPYLVPLPFVFEDYHFNADDLASAQHLGMGLDTAHATMAMRKVMEGFETILFNGTTVGTRQSMQVWGYRTHPQRVIGTAPGPWTDPTQIYPTVQTMFQAMLDNRRFGPYGLYMNVTQYGLMFAEQGVDRAWNVLKRIQESFPMVQSIKPIFAVPVGELVLIDLTAGSVDLAVKLEPGNIPWEEMGGLTLNVRVLGSLTPRVKVDAEGITGVVHFIGA